jgi:surface polysaccharide O-acyltransferase-like enzyme
MLAVVAVSAVNGYREYQKSGHLDPLWYIIVGVTIAVVLVVFAVFAKRRK